MKMRGSARVHMFICRSRVPNREFQFFYIIPSYLKTSNNFGTFLLTLN